MLQPACHDTAAPLVCLPVPSGNFPCHSTAVHNRIKCWLTTLNGTLQISEVLQAAREGLQAGAELTAVRCTCGQQFVERLADS